MKTKNARLTFNHDEIEMLMAALNSYSCEMMHKSETWANVDALMEGREDIYHRHANVLNKLWSRAYHAQQRIEQ